MTSFINVIAQKIGRSKTRHVFRCRAINNDSSTYLRFIYCSDYDNQSKINRHGNKDRDIPTLTRNSDTTLSLKDWDIQMEVLHHIKKEDK